MPKVLFIGLGRMGYPMAGHLSKNYEVTVHNRTVSKSIKKNWKEIGNYLFSITKTINYYQKYIKSHL